MGPILPVHRKQLATHFQPYFKPACNIQYSTAAAAKIKCFAITKNMQSSYANLWWIWIFFYIPNIDPKINFQPLLIVIFKCKFIVPVTYFYVQYCAQIYRPSFAKTSRKRSFTMIECERFGLVFANTGSLNSGTVSPSCPNLLWRPQVQHRSHIYCTVRYFKMLFSQPLLPSFSKDCCKASSPPPSPRPAAWV